MNDQEAFYVRRVIMKLNFLESRYKVKTNKAFESLIR